jgi:hypothetical protein
MATARLSLRVDLYEDRLGPGKIRLLEAIRDAGSITNFRAGSASLQIKHDNECARLSNTGRFSGEKRPGRRARELEAARLANVMLDRVIGRCGPAKGASRIVVISLRPARGLKNLRSVSFYWSSQLSAPLCYIALAVSAIFMRDHAYGE